jgi:outer membrane lipoprotein LolB
MWLQSKKWVLWGGVAWLVSACSSVSVEPGAAYSMQARQRLYGLDEWSFDGRLAIASQNDSWSANLNWRHAPGQDDMKLSGPLGQGTTIVRLTDKAVSIDQGDGKVQTSEQPEAFVIQQLGIFVPIQSLRYWVIGLPEPAQDFVETIDGFSQGGWLVSYKQMQVANGNSMPHKMSVGNSHVKLKLIVDQWIFNNANAK